MSSVYTTVWTGRYPAFCCGEWKLYKDNEEMYWIDIPFQNEPAETYGTYSVWYFNSDWEEQFDNYKDGMNVDEWIAKYSDWLESFAPESEWKDIYAAFQENDWRYGSCGGCI